MEHKCVAFLLILLTTLQPIFSREQQDKSLNVDDKTLLKGYQGAEDHNELPTMSMNNPTDQNGEGALATADIQNNAQNDLSEDELNENSSPDENNQYIDPEQTYDDLDESEMQTGMKDNDQYGMEAKDQPKNSPWGGRRRRRWTVRRRWAVRRRFVRVRRVGRIIRRVTPRFRRIGRVIRRVTPRVRRISRILSRSTKQIAKNLRRAVRQVTRKIRRSTRQVHRKIRRVRLRRTFGHLRRIVRRIVRRIRRRRSPTGSHPSPTGSLPSPTGSLPSPTGSRPSPPGQLCDTRCQMLKKLRRYLKFFEQAHCAYTTTLKMHVVYIISRNSDDSLLGNLRLYKRTSFDMNKDLTTIAKEMDSRIPSYNLTRLQDRCSKGESLPCPHRVGGNAMQKLKCQPVCYTICTKKDHELKSAIDAASVVFEKKLNEIETLKIK